MNKCVVGNQGSHCGRGNIQLWDGGKQEPCGDGLELVLGFLKYVCMYACICAMYMHIYVHIYI